VIDPDIKYKVGFDVHGVVDTKPVFVALARMLVEAGHEVHVITGARITDSFMKSLTDLGMRWTHIFSITDHHEKLGTPVTDDVDGNPHMPSKMWNPTKAWYCDQRGIHMHIDDSSIYGDYFREIDTVYLRVE